MAEMGRAVLDLTTALARFGDDGELLSHLARIFVDETPHRMDALRAGLTIDDASAVRTAAHGLKGVLYALGAAEPGDRADDIERHAGAGDLSAARPLAVALGSDVDALVATVATWPALLAPGPATPRGATR